MTETLVNPFAQTIQHSPFFRASCGCIGFYWGNAQHEAPGWEKGPMWSVVQACDRSDPDEHTALHNGKRGFDAEKTYIPLTATETEELLTYLNRLIYDGYRWNEFARNINWANESKLTAPEL